MLVGVLGPLQVVRDDGSVIDLPRRMDRRLLAALAARHPQRVTADSLVDALWGDSPPASARKTLQTNVFRLRQVLGRDTIVTVADGYGLNPGLRVDAEQFERTGDLAWWRGEPFLDLADWADVEARRARLSELRRRAEDVAAQSLLDAGRAADAVAELERLVVEDPAREHRWTLLVRALLAADRRPEALRAYDRARRTLASELGISPGAELRAAQYAALDDAESAPFAQDDAIVAIDRLLATAAAQSEGGDIRTATATYVQAASRAREAGDVRRFAESALGAAGDGVRVALDATDEVLGLVREALDRVPPGPTPTRSRLLARVCVLQSQHRPAAENEAAARRALDIARALDDVPLIVGALTAMTLAVVDPLRHDERARWIEELLRLGRREPGAPWLRWAQPLDARERVLTGDVAGALVRFRDLDAVTAADHDVVGHHAASYGHVLAATVAGDWAGARVAAARVRRTAADAMFDDGTAILGERGMVAIIELLEGVARPVAWSEIEWPTPEMTAAAAAYGAVTAAQRGAVDDADAALGRLGELMPGVARDGYWLSTVSLIAAAASLTENQAAAALAADLLAPVVAFTVTDPGLLYRGSAAHFAGLAAGVVGRPEAVELLREGLDVHQRHGATWMAERSRAAIRALTTLAP